MSRSRLQAALAGLVEGRQIAGRPVTGSMYFRYSFSAVLPLTKIRRIGAASRIGPRCWRLRSR